MKHAITLCVYMMLSVISYAQLTAPSLNTAAAKAKGLADDKVTFYALGSVNGSSDDVVKTITASGRLATAISFTEQIKLNIAANLLNANPASKIKKDSVDFNSLMFPETGNFGFMFNPTVRLWPFKKAGKELTNSIWLDGTYAYRKIAIDSPDVTFKINSVNIGIKYVWNYMPADEEKHFVFTLAAYGNFFNIPDEDVRKFNSVMKDSLFLRENKNAEIYSIGLKTTIQYKNFIFFADLRRNENTKGLDDSDPFKGTKFNIGFATLLRLKSF